MAARYRALVRTAYLITGNHEDAEDLVQTALARCVGAWPRIHGNPEPYVRRVLVRENVTRWRRRRWRETSTCLLPEQVAATPDLDSRMELAAALRRLAPRQRTAVVLRHVEGLTERETAHLMGCSVGTVKSQVHTGLARLRDLLGDGLPASAGALAQ